MHCNGVFFKEASLQLFPELEKGWEDPDGYRDVVPYPGYTDGKDLLSCFFFFTFLFYNVYCLSNRDYT